jgi:hypothetical protein
MCIMQGLKDCSRMTRDESRRLNTFQPQAATCFINETEL